MSQHMSGVQRASRRSRFSPSTLWILDLKSGHKAQKQLPLPTEPPCWSSKTFRWPPPPQRPGTIKHSHPHPISCVFSDYLKSVQRLFLILCHQDCCKNACAAWCTVQVSLWNKSTKWYYEIKLCAYLTVKNKKQNKIQPSNCTHTKWINVVNYIFKNPATTTTTKNLKCGTTYLEFQKSGGNCRKTISSTSSWAKSKYVR